MFEVDDFSDAVFLKILSQYTSENYLKRKPIVSLLRKFLLSNPLFENTKNSKDKILCVTENYYVSQSYIDDLVVYHSISFKNYEKFCKRIHLFSKVGELPFRDKATLESFLKSNTSIKNDILDDSYLGYVVVKPIEKTPIGVILAKPWNEKDISGTEVVKSLVDETVNFFGIPIHLRALAMQPQDPSVSICSVNSIWCVLHYGWKNFKVPMVSPAKISQKSGLSIDNGRLYPIGDRKGYNTSQVCGALKEFDLQPEIFDISKTNQLIDLKRIVYAYNKSGFPLLLGYKFPNNSEKPNEKNEDHLVTICGFKMKPAKINLKEQVPLKAYQITEIVVHDDQLGPYASIQVDGDMDNSNATIGVHGIWGLDTLSNKEPVPASVTSIIVPVPEGIRIRYEIVEGVVKKFCSIFEKNLPTDLAIFDQTQLTANDRTYLEVLMGIQEKFQKQEWDIYLIKSINYKKDLISTPQTEIAEGVKYATTTTTYPLYIWVASLSIDNKRHVDLIFDTTGSPDGDSLYQINFFNDIFKLHISLFIAVLDRLENMPKNYPSRLKEFIKTHISAPVETYNKFCFDDYHNFTKSHEENG